MKCKSEIKSLLLKFKINLRKPLKY